MQTIGFSALTVGFAAAMAVFFALPGEPPVWLGAILLLLPLALLEYAEQRSRPSLRSLALLLLAMAVGFAWAQARTQLQARQTGTLHMPQAGQTVTLPVTVDWAEPTPRGSRLVLQHGDHKGRPVKLTVYGSRAVAETLQPGCTADLRLTLMPLSLPPVLDGYDPRFAAWFAGERGRGFVREIVAMACPETLSRGHRLARLRLRLAAHYRASMSEEAGPVAAALITGVRGAIRPDIRDAFRHSGLAHMLAISGLHMALFAGSVYALLRLFSALWPPLVLRHDMRKPCAMAALLAATAYLALSGAGIATQRAYIMLAIFFLAVLIDRPAVTMRNVMWAMLIVLALQPQAVMQVGFQMSFAAVIALVAVYEFWQRHDRLYLRLDAMPALQRFLRLGWRYASALFVTSLVAGAVTGFIAVTRFHQIGAFGLPANLLAMPVFGTLIMPMAPLSVAALPFGMDGPAVAVMQFGLDGVIGLARRLTALDRAVLYPGGSPVWVLPAAAAGFLVLCLQAGRWRFLGLLPLALAAAFLGSGERPLAHLAGRDLVAVRENAETLVLLRQRGQGYALGRIRRLHGGPALNDRREACYEGCGVVTDRNYVVAYLTNPRRLTTACRSADLVILPYATARYPCRAMLLDAAVLQRGVPLEVVERDGRLQLRTPVRTRLWQR